MRAPATTAQRATVDVTIDEVVLRGVPDEQARDVTAHFEARLSELATQWASMAGPVLGRAESVRRLPVVDVPGRSAAAIGTALADAMWSELMGRTAAMERRR